MKRHRQSYRLKGYDYSGCGCYYVTICTKNRKCILGKVVDGEMALNHRGRIAREEWLRSADVRAELGSANAKKRQSCLAYLIRKAEEIEKEIILLPKKHQNPRAIGFCRSIASDQN